MTEEDFLKTFDMLSKRISSLPEPQRHACQPELHALVERALEAGLILPEAVRELDDVLTEAAIEAQFDNLPL